MQIILSLFEDRSKIIPHSPIFSDQDHRPEQKSRMFAAEIPIESKILIYARTPKTGSTTMLGKKNDRAVRNFLKRIVKIRIKVK